MILLVLHVGLLPTCTGKSGTGHDPVKKCFAFTHIHRRPDTGLSKFARPNLNTFLEYYGFGAAVITTPT